jgi:hypothetical protein
MEDQEIYLEKTGFKLIIVRGMKKVITELTSIKTMALVGVFSLLATGKIDSWAGIAGILTLVGIRDLPESILGRAGKVINSIVKDKEKPLSEQ